MNLLQQLINEGVVMYYVDFRSGSAIDHINGLTPTIASSNTNFLHKKLSTSTTGALTIGSSEFQIGTGNFTQIVKYVPKTLSASLGSMYMNLITAQNNRGLYSFESSGNMANTIRINNISSIFTVPYSINEPIILGVSLNRPVGERWYLNGQFKQANTTLVAQAGYNVTLSNIVIQNFTAARTEYIYTLLIKKALTDAEMATLISELERKKWTTKLRTRTKCNIISDGDSEHPTTSFWTGAVRATVDKDTTTKISGTQSLKITSEVGNTTTGYARQDTIVTGKSYKVSGWYKTSGLAPAYVGTTITSTYFNLSNPTEWTYFTGEMTNVDRDFFVMGVKNTSASPANNSVWFDNVVVEEIGSSARKKFNYKPEYGIRADQKAYTTGIPISNSCFNVDGSVIVRDGMYKGEKTKEVFSAGVSFLYLPTSAFGQTPTEAAYGTWEFITKAANSGSTNTTKFIADNTIGGAADGDNYNVTIRQFSGDTMSIQLRVKSTNLITIDTATIGVDYKIKVTRNRSGLFTLFIDDVLIGTATNTAYTTSTTFQTRISAGNAFLLCSEKGTYGIIKK